MNLKPDHPATDTPADHGGRHVGTHPWRAMALSGALGYLIGAWLRRR